MDENLFNDFLFGKWKWVTFVVNADLFHVLYLFLCNGGIYRIGSNNLVYTHESFSILPLLQFVFLYNFL